MSTRVFLLSSIVMLAMSMISCSDSTVASFLGTPDECFSSADCEEGKVCEDGFCMPEEGCTKDEDCPEGMLCRDDGECFTPTTGSCPGGECTWDSDCPEGKICTDACMCIPDPNQTADGDVDLSENDSEIPGDVDVENGDENGEEGTVADRDQDTVADAIDNCPDTPNKEQTDSDGDGVGDACDNCPSYANREQANQDGDDWGDACDPTPNEAGTCADVTCNPAVENACAAWGFSCLVEGFGSARCTKDCTSDADCPKPFACTEDGRCGCDDSVDPLPVCASCTSAADCRDPLPACEAPLNDGDLMCTRGCTVDGDCPESYFCHDQRCLCELKRPPECQTIVCQDAGQCTAADLTICARIDGFDETVCTRPCSTASDCPEAYECENSLCVCRQDPPVTYECPMGQCTSGSQCRDELGFPDNAGCLTGDDTLNYCTIPCDQNSDCTVYFDAPNWGCVELNTGQKICYCEPPCEYGASECRDNEIYRCSSQGLWVAERTCENGTQCVDGDGGAFCEAIPECEDGESECRGDIVYRCVNGTFAAVESCEQGWFCDEFNGEAVCVPAQALECPSGECSDRNDCYDMGWPDEARCIVGSGALNYCSLPCTSTADCVTDFQASNWTCETISGVSQFCICDPPCSNGDAECRDNAVYFCQNGVWRNIQDCEDGWTCRIGADGASCYPDDTPLCPTDECTSGSDCRNMGWPDDAACWTDTGRCTIPCEDSYDGSGDVYCEESLGQGWSCQRTSSLPWQRDGYCNCEE